MEVSTSNVEERSWEHIFIGDQGSIAGVLGYYVAHNGGVSSHWKFLRKWVYALYIRSTWTHQLVAHYDTQTPIDAI